MKAALSLILLLIMNGAFAQDFTTRCGRSELRYDYGGKGNFSMAVLCPYTEYKSTAALPKAIVEKNRQYLLNRVGSNFMSKLKLESTFIVDFSNANLVKHKNWLEKADKRVKYAFQYYFIIQKGVRYYFTTVYDSLGNLISNHMVPSQKENNNFGTIINMCRAKQLSERDSLSNGRVENISLEYSDSTNSFVWEAELTPTKTENPQLMIRHFLILNASSGIIINRKNEESYSSCDGNTPSFPKLK